MRQVLITGGGSGIGRAVAQDFAAKGDSVTIAGRRMDALEETNAKGDMRCMQVDVTDEASVRALFDTGYDVVVANAGAGYAMPVADMPLQVWNDTLSVNLTGVFLTFRAALADMKPGGCLVWCGHWPSKLPVAGSPAMRCAPALSILPWLMARCVMS